MIYREIVHTCANTYVADAALISLGGEIARAVADDANRHAMSRGAYAAKLVRDFAREAKRRRPVACSWPPRTAPSSRS